MEAACRCAHAPVLLVAAETAGEGSSLGGKEGEWGRVDQVLTLHAKDERAERQALSPQPRYNEGGRQGRSKRGKRILTWGGRVPMLPLAQSRCCTGSATAGELQQEAPPAWV